MPTDCNLCHLHVDVYCCRGWSADCNVRLEYPWIGRGRINEGKTFEKVKAKEATDDANIKTPDFVEINVLALFSYRLDLYDYF